MQYIIMCGGDYTDQFETPKPLLKVAGEVLVERTIRLLKENGIKDIAISTNSPLYEYLGVELLHHDNNYKHKHCATNAKVESCWLNAYYPTNEPVCYLHGDVYWTDDAIKKVIDKDVKNTMFICAPDKQDGRKNASIKGREPLGFKVVNQKVFRQAIDDIKAEIDKYKYEPISWHLYRRLNRIEQDYEWFGNDIFKTKGDYLVIDDLTTDIDLAKNIPAQEKLIQVEEIYRKGGKCMVKVKVVEGFFLNETDYNSIKELVRANESNNQEGRLYVNDIFICNEQLADYLEKSNRISQENPERKFIEVMEVIPKENSTKIEISEEKEDIVPLKSKRIRKTKK